MFSLISVAVFIVAVYIMNKTFIGFQPGTNRINSDVGKFRASAAKWQPELVPWTFAEMELLSLSEKNKVTKKGFGRSANAIVESIYHEPMLYYHLKEYPATSKNSVLFARTKKHEFVYRIRSKDVQVFADEHFVGTLDHQGMFYLAEARLVLGQIDRSDYYRRRIKVGDVQVGSVMFPQEKPNVNPRALDMDEKMEGQNHVLFVAQAIYEIVLYLNEIPAGKSERALQLPK